jgi:hypothetical protein
VWNSCAWQRRLVLVTDGFTMPRLVWPDGMEMQCSERRKERGGTTCVGIVIRYFVLNAGARPPVRLFVSRRRENNARFRFGPGRPLTDRRENNVRCNVVGEHPKFPTTIAGSGVRWCCACSSYPALMTKYMFYDKLPLVVLIFKRCSFLMWYDMLLQVFFLFFHPFSP